MFRKRIFFLFIICMILSACSHEPEQIPATDDFIVATEPFSAENIIEILDIVPQMSYSTFHKEIGSTYAGGIVSSCFHTPEYGNLIDGDGLFTVCVDPLEMNQGSHYNAVLVADDLVANLPRSFFSNIYTVFDRPFTVDFEYTYYDDTPLITYICADSFDFRLYPYAMRDGCCVIQFACQVDNHYFDYPMLLNVRTGELTDFLHGIAVEDIPSDSINNLILMDRDRLLIRANSGVYYFWDTPAGKIYEISQLTGYPVAYCGAAGDVLVCHDGDGNFRTVDANSLAVDDVLSDVDPVMFYGLTSNTNQTFALYRNENGLLHYYDFLSMTGGPMPEPQGWVLEPEMLYPSYNGRSVFQFHLDDLGRFQVLVFDCDKQSFILLNRTNPNPVRESHIAWTRDDSLVITSVTGQDFYVYQWKAQDSDEMITLDTPVFQPTDADFVAVKDYIPDLLVEMKYAYPDNFTGHSIYEFEEAYLRYGTVRKLMAVQEELKPMGLYLKLWDGFRPVAAQFKLWEILPDSTYVANPNVGFSSHSRGNTVDITLVDSQGREVHMPTGFDDFSTMADRDYSDCDELAASNAMLLEDIMHRNGFVGYFGEWWHFADSVKYDVETCFNPALISVWKAKCDEFISLRSDADTSAAVLDRIPVRETVTLLGYSDEFAFVEFRGQRGYVLNDYLEPA